MIFDEYECYIEKFKLIEDYFFSKFIIFQYNSDKILRISLDEIVIKETIPIFN